MLEKGDLSLILKLTSPNSYAILDKSFVFFDS